MSFVGIESISFSYKFSLTLQINLRTICPWEECWWFRQWPKGNTGKMSTGRWGRGKSLWWERFWGVQGRFCQWDENIFHTPDHLLWKQIRLGIEALDRNMLSDAENVCLRLFWWNYFILNAYGIYYILIQIAYWSLLSRLHEGLSNETWFDLLVFSTNK